jgi:hypothetical protein
MATESYRDYDLFIGFALEFSTKELIFAMWEKAHMGRAYPHDYRKDKSLIVDLENWHIGGDRLCRFLKDSFFVDTKSGYWNPQPPRKLLFMWLKVVGGAGFEPATPGV